MDALLTSRGCATNQQTCRAAISKIIEDLKPFSLERYELDRLFWCGRCEKFVDDDSLYDHENQVEYGDKLLGLDNIDDVITFVELVLKNNLLRIERMDMDRGDEEVARLRRRAKRQERRENERDEG